MVTNRKVTGTAMSMPAGLALGGLASLAVTVAGSVLAAHLILKERIPESGVGYCSLFILLLSSVLGAAISVNRIKRRRLYVCALSAAVYYGILLSITALFRCCSSCRRVSCSCSSWGWWGSCWWDVAGLSGR